MLANRFKLAVHREEKTLPVYLVAVAKNGPKLRRSEGAGGPGRVSFPRGRVTSQRVSMERLAEILSFRLGRPVVDRTELKGFFEVTLAWAEGEGGSNSPLQAGDSPSWPSIFTAVQEQLGLTLEAEKLPVDIIVIDHVERPSEN